MTLPLYSFPAPIPKTNSLGVATVELVAVPVKGVRREGREGIEQWSLLGSMSMCCSLSLSLSLSLCKRGISSLLITRSLMRCT